MYLLLANGETIELQNTAKPQMRDYGGRTWDSAGTLEVDGERTKFFADTTWGRYAYFAVGYYVGDVNEDTDLWEWQESNEETKARTWYKFDVFEAEKLWGVDTAQLKRGKPPEESSGSA